MTELAMPEDINIRSAAYYIASASAPCTSCRRKTRILAIALSAEHETLEIDADECGGEPAADAWQPATLGAVLFFVSYLPEAVRLRLQRLSPSFRRGRSQESDGAYWMNHCEHCGAVQDDHDLHCEPEGAFTPASAESARQIELLEVREPLAASAAGYAFEPEFFEFLPRSRSR
jgi:hypothetical protein